MDSLLFIPVSRWKQVKPLLFNPEQVVDYLKTALKRRWENVTISQLRST